VQKTNQKKQNRSNENNSTKKVNRGRAPINLPMLATVDVLGVMPDDELFDRIKMLDLERETVVDGHYDTKVWDEEIAYVQRELQLRRDRRIFHDRYLNQTQYNDQHEYQHSHVGEADIDVELDNSMFVRLSEARDALRN